MKFIASDVLLENCYQFRDLFSCIPLVVVDFLLDDRDHDKIAYQIVSESLCSQIPDNERVDCYKIPQVNERVCKGWGCCWDPSAAATGLKCFRHGESFLEFRQK
jgi:hypothetical protein